MSEYRDYENGVADVLAFLAPEGSIVERNVMLPGRRSKRNRQVDVVVRGQILGTTSGLLAVDCKCWGKRVDVKAVESFIGNLDDVGADRGLLMTTEGLTDGARERAREERGVVLEVMSLQQLRSWSPKGTVTVTYRIPVDRRSEAERVLRNAGYRVAHNASYEAGAGEVVLDVFRYYGTSSPSGELQSEQVVASQAALSKLGIDPEHVASGVTISGGTPAHRWLEVVIAGQPTGLKILVATEADVKREIDNFPSSMIPPGIDRESITVLRPDGWPFSDFFGSWAFPPD